MPAWLKSHAKSTYISLLYDDTGQERVTIPDLLSVTHSFYSKLYTPSAVTLSTQDALLANLTAQVTPPQKQMLDAPITLAELATAVYQLPLDKTPGVDGIISLRFIANFGSFFMIGIWITLLPPIMHVFALT